MLLPLVAAALLATAAPSLRQVAVTFDDLPGVSVVGEGAPAMTTMTEKLLAAITRSGAPAIGFVNEGKLSPDGIRDEARVALLRQWLGAGFELGNHTYSHWDLHHTALPAFEEDLVRGEEVTKALLKERGLTLRYFRHPFLHTGRDLATKKGLEEFLARRGYTIAPVTHDNADWIFARAYANALGRTDQAAAARIAASYVPYMDAKFDYFERQSKALFSREIPLVLLLHANSLNADHFEELAAMIKRRGYAFVPLAQALADPAYRSPDSYVGPAGMTWLHRWALTRAGASLLLPDEPQVPDFVLAEAGVSGE